MRTCQRCIHGEVSWTEDTVILAGDVVATLCNACRTEWTSVVRDSAAWRRRNEIEARHLHYDSLAKARTPVAKAEWVALVGDRTDNDGELHAIGIAFVRPLPSPVPVAERDD